MLTNGQVSDICIDSPGSEDTMVYAKGEFEMYFAQMSSIINREREVPQMTLCTYTTPDQRFCNLAVLWQFRYTLTTNRAAITSKR
jgi:hypothetical protein